MMSSGHDAAMETDDGFVMVEAADDDRDLLVPADHGDAADCEYCEGAAQLVFLEIPGPAEPDGLVMLKVCCRHAASYLLLQQDGAERLARRADAVMVLGADSAAPACSTEANLQSPCCQMCSEEAAAKLEATVQSCDGFSYVRRVCWDHAACLCVEMQTRSLKLQAVKRLC